jgi:hypothetical protein
MYRKVYLVSSLIFVFTEAFIEEFTSFLPVCVVAAFTEEFNSVSSLFTNSLQKSQDTVPFFIPNCRLSVFNTC